MAVSYLLKREGYNGETGGVGRSIPYVATYASFAEAQGECKLVAR